MGSHTRVAPSGKTISTRVVTSKLRHFSAARGLKGSCCARASFGSATAAGAKVPAFRNARLSISVLLSIERHLTMGLARPRAQRVECPLSVAAKRAEKLGRRRYGGKGERRRT